ncbi:MAG: Unknown protein [uncultured Sulfurovum sp.]|uniref:Uncharacterized protein n=1 Tax=uncultured Sulfurovum sp. TaxID=269237 RepID=A0A6S6S376_9BACT|nr:MAG: Unknown protein [uncultured Sulfurovum sp.]
MSINQAANKLMQMEKYIQEERDYHPFKYEMNDLIDDFVESNQKLSSDKWKIIFYCIGLLTNSSRYAKLNLNDFVR